MDRVCRSAERRRPGLKRDGGGRRRLPFQFNNTYFGQRIFNGAYQREALVSPTAGKKGKESKCPAGAGQRGPFFYPLCDIRLTLRNIRGLGMERSRKRKRRRER